MAINVTMKPATWSRRRKIGATALVFLFVLVGTLLVLAQPTEPEEPLNVSEQNSEVYAKLVEANITDAVVDINESRALIRYEVPDEMTVEDSEYYVMGAAASVAENASTIRLQVYKDFEKVEEATVTTSDVIAYREGDISFNELKDRLERTSA